MQMHMGIGEMMGGMELRWNRTGSHMLFTHFFQMKFLDQCKRLDFLLFNRLLQAMHAAAVMQHQWHAAHQAQRKAQNAAKAAKQALASLQKLQQDRCCFISLACTTPIDCTLA